MTDTPALEFDDVSYAYPGGALALEDVSFAVAPGERVGVLGPNGAGKSTLLKLARGEMGGFTGQISVFGADPKAARHRGEIAYVPQRAEAILDFPLSVRQVVALGAAHAKSPLMSLKRACGQRVERALELVGATEYAEKPVGAISGGQLQRTLLARAIAARPRILALDEPTVGVDIVGQQRFAELLGSLGEQLDITIIVISHDIRAIASSCDRVLCMARRMHLHASPDGLTPAVLAEVFQHDVAAAIGDVHVEAHFADDCPGGHHHGVGGSVASDHGDASARD